MLRVRIGIASFTIREAAEEPDSRTGRRRLPALTIALLLLGSGCAGAGGTSEDGDRELLVLAAASLTEAFQSLEQRFSDSHPGVSTKLSFESSAALVAQVQQGVRADVIATADEETMARLAAADLLAEPPEVFALNELTIIVERGNPQNVRGLADLSRETLKVVLAAEEVPAGTYARRALDAADVEVHPVSLEEDVKAVVSKVSLGEADAGIAYVTDAMTSGSAVTTVPISQDQNVAARYPIAVLREAPNGGLAQAFVAFVRSPGGMRALTEAGFGLP